MPRPPGSPSLVESLRVALKICIALALSGSAQATPVDVFFDGLPMDGDPDTAFGLSAEQAATLPGDLPFINDWNFLGTVVGSYDVSQGPVGAFSPDPPISSENRASASWDVTNVSGQQLAGASYLVFTHTDPFEVGGIDIEYADSNVGMTIDAELGWVIILTSENGSDYFYPAILLDRSVPNPLDGVLEDGETSDPFSIDYVTKQALVEAPIGSGDYQLPELQIARAFTLVPEPASGLLVAAGLGLLARGRLRRS